MSTDAREPVVHISRPMPNGYSFVRKGNVYITKNCRKLTHESHAPVYIVQDDKKFTQGIRVPTRIWHKVRAMNAETKASRAEAVQKKDQALEEKARIELVNLFPDMPDEQIGPILKHTLKKRSGRVGRSTGMPLDQAVNLAVRAHIRHVHTEYDKLLRKGVEREEARKKVQKEVDSKVREWGGQPSSRSRSPERRQAGKKKKTENNSKGLKTAMKTSMKDQWPRLPANSTAAGKGRNAKRRRRSLRLEEMRKKDESDEDWDPMDLD